MSENKLILCANAMSDDPERVADYSCQWCDKRATGYLFMGPQFCDEHDPVTKYEEREVRLATGVLKDV